MKLVIKGRGKYPAASVQGASTLHLVELQQQARIVDPDTGLQLIEGGLGMARMERMRRANQAYQRELEAWQRERKEWEESDRSGPEPDPYGPDIPDEAVVMGGIGVFLSIRASGERITFRDALLIPLPDISHEPEPGDVQAAAEADPTTPGSDGPATPAGDAQEPAEAAQIGPSTT